MPLHERVIQPINVSRSTLPLPPGDIKPLVKNIASISGQGLAASAAASANVNIVNELECVTNGTLSNLIRQLSSLSRQAEELLTGVFDEASKILNRTVVLQQRIDGLAVKVETLDQLNEVSITLRNPTNHPETFASDMLFNQQVLSKQQLPSSIAELYKNCDEPPPLSKLDPYRDDGKDSLKFYTDPTYFFELWKKDMLKSQQQFQSLAQNNANNNNQHSQRQSQQSMVSNRTLQNNKRSSQQQLPNQQPQQISTMPQTQQIIYVHREQGQQQPLSQTTSQPHLIKQHQPQQQQLQMQQGQQRNDLGIHQQQQNNQLKSQNMQYDTQQQLQNQKAQSHMGQLPNVQTNQDQYMNNSPSMGNIGPPPPPALSPLPPSIESSPAPPPALSPLPPQTAPPQTPLAVPTPPPPPPPPPAPPAPSLPQLSKPTSNQPMFAPPMVTAAQLQQKQSQLKKAEPALPRDPRSDLLAAIKQGISLKKVEQTRKEQAEKQQGMGDTVAAILARRIAVQDSDYEDNDDDDDNEWDESSNQ